MPTSRIPDHLALLLARWMDHRLDDTGDGALVAPRWYGLEVIDADALALVVPEAVRAVYVGDCGFEALLERDRFDAIAEVRHRWLLPLRQTPRPGAWPARRRARTVEVTMGAVSAGVARFDGEAQLLEFPPAA